MLKLFFFCIECFYSCGPADEGGVGEEEPFPFPFPLVISTDGVTEEGVEDLDSPGGATADPTLFAEESVLLFVAVAVLELVPLLTELLVVVVDTVVLLVVVVPPPVTTKLVPRPNKWPQYLLSSISSSKNISFILKNVWPVRRESEPA